MKALIATDGTTAAITAAHGAVALLHPDLEIEIRLVSGSVMEYAAHHAPCPVLIVRHADD